MQLLVSSHADVNAPTAGGWTPLHAAAEMGHCGVIALLLDAGCDVSARSLSGDTCLHSAARWGRTSAVNLLLDSCADVTVVNEAGLTPLQVVVYSYVNRGSRLNECPPK